MRTSILHDAFTSTGNAASFRRGGIAQPGWPPASRRGIQDHRRAAQELAWLLIWLLIFFYLAGSYLFWAKAGAAWPF